MQGELTRFVAQQWSFVANEDRLAYRARCHDDPSRIMIHESIVRLEPDPVHPPHEKRAAIGIVAVRGNVAQRLQIMNRRDGAGPRMLEQGTEGSFKKRCEAERLRNHANRFALVPAQRLGQRYGFWETEARSLQPGDTIIEVAPSDSA
ncbi:hypothetical protein ACNFJ7_00145 [Sphingomonas sp. HT-1]|uniref:hypothetical protein n=1 Tax=unclassified Sphingomonas TaxID=196159 RepID=UPI0009E9443B|nr:MULTISPECIES: hypothetical protein [unclassified Sphingomonas]